MGFTPHGFFEHYRNLTLPQCLCIIERLPILRILLRRLGFYLELSSSYRTGDSCFVAQDRLDAFQQGQVLVCTRQELVRFEGPAPAIDPRAARRCPERSLEN